MSREYNNIFFEDGVLQELSRKFEYNWRLVGHCSNPDTVSYISENCIAPLRKLIDERVRELMEGNDDR